MGNGGKQPGFGDDSPLAKLLRVSADELLGLHTEKDIRRKELENAYENTWETGDLEERHRIAGEAVHEYPGNMKYLNWLAWAGAMRSFGFQEDGKYEEEQEKAIKRFATVIENCEEREVKASAIAGITQYLSFGNRFEEAKKYAQIYPESDPISKDDVFQHCLTGEELLTHRQKMLNKALHALIFKLQESKETFAAEAIVSLLQIMFPSGCYLHYHCFAHMAKLRLARHSTLQEAYEAALSLLKEARAHALAYDGIDIGSPGIYSYTDPLFNCLQIDTSAFIRTGTGSQLDDFYAELEKDWAKPLRGREDFRLLLGREPSLS